jgi:mannose-1-phosphate guanylyltransferase
VQAVVLVGGEGTRLRPLTLSTPKQLLPIVGVALLERVLAHLWVHGVDEAVLSLGYLPDAFLSAYPDSLAAGVRLTYAVEPEPMDTAGAVGFAARHAGIDETFVVVNGDVLTDLDLSRLIAFHRAQGAEGTIALHPVDDPSAFGVVPTEDDGRVQAFVEKPPRDEAPTNLINAGTYVLEPSFLDRVPPGRRTSIERETFPAMAREGSLFALADDAYWLDTGTPADYLRANLDLVSGVRGGGDPSPGAHRLESGVWATGEPEVNGALAGACFLADGAVVSEGARVVQSVLGPRTVVEPGAVVTGSVLLDGARVAADAEVTDSVLGPHSTVGERCVVGHVSVLGADAVVPSGTSLDGARVPG